MKLDAHSESWPTLIPFQITGMTYNSFESIVVELSQDGKVGRGEALGVDYRGETIAGMMAQVEALRATIGSGVDRKTLLDLLPPGGARNALDCALWDLEAKTSGRTIWQLTGVKPKSLQTVFTIGIESTAEQMATKAAAAKGYQLLKIKSNGNRPVECLRAIRQARPDVRLVVDANQGWSMAQLESVLAVAADLRIEMIEQPLPREADGALANLLPPIPLCADESCLHLGELDRAASLYQMINIKLDKAGGLTHALALATAARARGLGVMTGSMGGTSLAMAPAFVMGCLSDFTDIDGPLLQRSDRLPGLFYQGNNVEIFGPELWG
jgi:L-alanine-DL-glutamate epimerase-like enolase superfamily enzyme